MNGPLGTTSVERGLVVRPFKLNVDGQELSVGGFNLKPGSVTLLNGKSDAPVAETLLAFAGLREVLEHRLRPTNEGLAPKHVKLLEILRGRITLNGEDLLEMKPMDRARKVALVFENPEWGFLCSTVEEDFCYSFGACGLEPPPPYTLRRYGLFEARSIAPEFLSGGEQQRLACAAVMERPLDVVFADFSSSNLDRYFRDEVLRPWVERSRQDGTIFMIRGISTHGMSLVDGVVDVTKTNVKYKAYPNGYTVPQSDKAEKLLSSALAKRGSLTDNRVIITAEKFRRPFSKGPLTLVARAGEVKLLVGPNGAGKTTFGRAVVELGSSAKQLTLADDVIPAMSLQNPERSLFAGSVAAELNGDEQLLAMCGLDAASKKRHPLTLSRAKQKLVSIAAALRRAVDLAILDEPTLGLDDSDISLFARIIEHYSNLTIIMMTHDPTLRAAAATAGVEIVDLEIMQ
ncbi:MAG: ATP-binding cassette domain-containing protein [Sphingomonas sp.]